MTNFEYLKNCERIEDATELISGVIESVILYILSEGEFPSQAAIRDVLMLWLPDEKKDLTHESSREEAVNKIQLQDAHEREMREMREAKKRG